MSNFSIDFYLKNTSVLYNNTYSVIYLSQSMEKYEGTTDRKETSYYGARSGLLILWVPKARRWGRFWGSEHSYFILFNKRISDIPLVLIHIIIKSILHLCMSFLHAKIDIFYGHGFLLLHLLFLNSG